MVVSEGFSAFIGFKVGGSKGMLPQEKLNVQDFRKVILGILANLLYITTPIFRIEVNIAWKKLTNYSWSFSYI